MKIVLIAGRSGVGKSTICEELSKNTEKYNLILSYTDRPKRKDEKEGHIFVDSAFMDALLERKDVVAQTQIDEYRYCTLYPQFDEHKVNLYVVDVYGINDTMKSFPQADIMSLLIQRKDVDISDYRAGRNIAVPIREDVDFLIDNNSTVESAAKTIDVLIGFDFFRKPSHTVKTIEESLTRIDEQRRYLAEIERSLQTQLWLRDKPLYKQLCECLRTSMKDGGYDVVIDESDEVEFDEFDSNDALYVIIIKSNKIIETWAEEHEMLEYATKIMYEFCDKHECRDMLYHIHFCVNDEHLYEEIL